MNKASLKCIISIAILLLFTFSISCNSNEGEIQDKDLEKELEFLAKAYPDSIPLQLLYWEQKFTTGQKNNAIDSLMHLSERYPDNTVLLNGIAELALQNSDTGLALHFLGQSLSVLPVQSETEFRMAGILEIKRDTLWEKITKNLIERENDPIAISRGYYLMGVHLANENKTKEAIEAFGNSIALNYTFTDAYIEKAILLLEKNQTDEASALLYKALELDRKSADIHFLIGECWMKRKNSEKALAFYEETLRLDPDYESAQTRIDKIKP